MTKEETAAFHELKMEDIAYTATSEYCLSLGVVLFCLMPFSFLLRNVVCSVECTILTHDNQKMTD